MTPAQVTARLGPPNGVSDSYPNGKQDEWSYQRGMDPDATITFSNGVVVRVELLRYRGSPP